GSGAVPVRSWSGACSRSRSRSSVRAVSLGGATVGVRVALTPGRPGSSGCSRGSSGSFPDCGGVAACDLLAHERQHVPAVVDGVVEVVVAADGDDLGTEVDVVEERGGDGLRGADVCGARARPGGGLGVGGPQGPVVDLAAFGELQQQLRAAVLRGAGLGATLAGVDAGGAVAFERAEHAVGLLPGEFLGGGDDGTEGHPDLRAVGAAGGAGVVLDPVAA